MFNRFLAVLLACFLAFSVVCIPVFATDDSSSASFGASFEEYLAETISYIESVEDVCDLYLNGYITYSEYCERISALYDNAPNTYAALACVPVTSIVDEFSAFFDAYNSLLSDFGYSGTLDSVVDDWINVSYGGGGGGGSRYGALYIKDNPNLTWIEYYYCDYIELYNNSSGDLCFRCVNLRRLEYHYRSDGSIVVVKDDYDEGYNHTSSVSLKGYDSFKGDVRLLSDDISDVSIGDMPTVGDSDFTFPDDLDDDSLRDLIDYINSALQDAFPDLSSVEGILKSILNKLGTLDSDDDSSYLSAIESAIRETSLSVELDTAIASLITQNNENTQALLDELIKLREVIVSDEDDSEYYDEDGNLDVSLISSIISAISSIFSILSLTGDLALPAIVDIADLGVTGIKMLSSYVTLSIAYLNTFPLNDIADFLNTLEAVFLTDRTQSSLTYTFNGQTYVFLNAGLLTNPYFVQAVTIAKALVSLMVLYKWLRWCRNFFSSLA